LYESTYLRKVEFADGLGSREITWFQKHVKMRDINIPESVEAETTVSGCENLGGARYGPAGQLKKIW
jgi:hypothetical protein